MHQSRDSIGIEEISDDELFQFLPGYLSVPVFVDDLHVGGDICCSGLEALIHCSVAIDQPLGNLNSLAYSVTIAIISLDDLSEFLRIYLARLRH